MKVVTRNELHEYDLSLLMNDEIQVLRIINFFSDNSCQELLKKLENCNLLGRYKNAPLIKRIGRAFYETINNPKEQSDYFESATLWIKEIRKNCSPLITPIDLLRLVLDEAWIHGVNLATINDKKMFVGLVRKFSTGSYAEAHQDHLEWDTNNSDYDLKNQIACNVFLKLPKYGGEIIIYDQSLSKKDYEKNRIDGSYGINLDSSIKKTAIQLRPRIGELILFSSHKTHALSTVDDGEHVAWSSFVGFSGNDKPLIIWS
ncbi:MAG: 2OG-Fe(II) oxygenase [Candidatus Gracilibacteria bacterium]|nr:2OG-Fe(II) oxygenase [Candidatus Gracilibacteria bacterium]MDP2396426.1 2OG-Fe(II) oxygenase [bacterium]MDP3381453.1 2OG-Fe(II) oxygenase [bacterium]